jgi:outer membrane receptor protein involved in Fe transport
MFWHTKNYNFWWQYNPDSRNENFHKTLNLSAILNHTLSQNTFYTLGISQYSKSRKQRVYRWIDGERIELIPAPLDPADADSSLLDYYYRSSEPTDPYYSEFNTGNDEYWTDEFQTTYNLRFDLTSQLSYRHLFKTGVDIRYFDLDVNEQSQVHLGGAHYTNIYQKNPIQASYYLQDKMEYDYLILNVGLRLDYEKSEGSFWSEPTEWKSEEKKAKPYWRLSPRIGAAIPVSEGTIFHFNYGIFYQHAAYANRFRNPDRERALKAIWPILGNPLLEPEETIAYEIGLKQKLTQNMFFEVNLWLKKTSNMVGTVWVPQFTDATHTNPQYGVFANLDYSSARGIDFTLKKRYSNYIDFEFNYSYSLSTGIREDQFQGYRSRHTPALMPAQERILNWNQPHVLRFNFFLRYPPTMDSYILRNLRFSLLYSGNSGYPYTPSTVREVAIGPINSSQRPFQHYIDVRLIKSFMLSSFSISPYIEVDNLLDTKNIVFSYVTTGSTTDPGDIWGGTTTYRDRPWYYGRRRQIRLGLNIDFNAR